MRQRVQRGLLAGLIGMCAAQLAGEGRALAQEQSTIQGEVVDPALYVKDARHGPGTEGETYEAVNGGQTLGLLETTTNTLYLLLAEEPGEDPNELVYEYINQLVKVTGAVYQRGGIRGVVLKSVEPLTPQPQRSLESSPTTNTQLAPAPATP